MANPTEGMEWFMVYKRSFVMSIGSSDTAYDLNIQRIPIRPGFITKVKVTQTQHKSSDSMLSMSRDQRGCRFKHEAEDLRLFKEYSKQACQYECAIEKCKDICGCIPWDFPRTDEEYNSAPVCDLAGNHCFNRLLKKVF